MRAALIELGAQPCARPRQPRHHGADRHADDRRDPGIAHLLDGDEQQHLALLRRQALQRALEVAQLEPVGLHRAHRLLGQRVAGTVLGPRALAPQAVDEQVVHDAEHPGAHLAAPLPALARAPGALERVLHQVVGTVAVGREPARIAPQARDAGHDLGFVPRLHRSDG